MREPYTKEDQLSKNKKIFDNTDLLNKSITIRVSKSELKKKVNFILDKTYCQVCETSTDLDYPHHSLFGLAKKDDRTLINICVNCHRIIHQKGFDTLLKTKEETIKIGWENNKEYLEIK